MPLFSTKAVFMGAAGLLLLPSSGGSWVKLMELNNTHSLATEDFLVNCSQGSGRDTFDVCGYMAVSIDYLNDGVPEDTYLQLMIFDIDMELLHEKYYSNFVASHHINLQSNVSIRDNGNVVISRWDDAGAKSILEEYTATTFAVSATRKLVYSVAWPTNIGTGGGYCAAGPSGVAHTDGAITVTREVDELDPLLGSIATGLDVNFFPSIFDYKTSQYFFNRGTNDGSKSKNPEGQCCGMVDISGVASGEAYHIDNASYNGGGYPPIPLGAGKWLFATGVSWLICLDGHPTHRLTGSPFELQSNYWGSRCLHPTLNRCWIACHPSDLTLSNYIGYLNNDLSWGSFSKITLDGNDGAITGMEALSDGSVYFTIGFFLRDPLSVDNVALLYRYEYSATTLSTVIGGFTVTQTPVASPATISQGAGETWTLSDNTTANSTEVPTTVTALAKAGSDITTDYVPTRMG